MKNLIRKILKENDDLQWMDGVSNKPLPMRDRSRVKFSEIFESKLRSMGNQQRKNNMIDYLDGDGILKYDEEDDSYTWYGEPNMVDGEQKGFIEWGLDTPEWRYVTEETVDYELEYSQSTELVIYQRKSDGRFFGFQYENYYHDGPQDSDEYLTERFKQKETREIWV